MLKIIGSLISPWFASLANESFQAGICSHTLKVAKVVSLFRKGNPELLSNYRPISLLSIFSKLFEKLMYKDSIDFLRSTIFFIFYSFGFKTIGPLIMPSLV